jgi:hypothetical protein
MQYIPSRSWIIQVVFDGQEVICFGMNIDQMLKHRQVLVYVQRLLFEPDFKRSAI